MIRPYDQPLKKQAGFMVVSGNLFDSALVKTSVISEDFRRRYLSTPGSEECFISRAIVFDGPEDYRRRIDDPELKIDETCMLVVRGAGPVGFPGSAEVVNMTPPGSLVSSGVRMLPCLGDGRQSGTSDTPSILNASPESAVGGNLAILRTGDKVKVDLKNRRVDLLESDEEISRRPCRAETHPAQERFAVAAALPGTCGAARNRSLPGVRRGLPGLTQSSAAAFALSHFAKTTTYLARKDRSLWSRLARGIRMQFVFQERWSSTEIPLSPIRNRQEIR